MRPESEERLIRRGHAWLHGKPARVLRMQTGELLNQFPLTALRRGRRDDFQFDVLVAARDAAAAQP